MHQSTRTARVEVFLSSLKIPSLTTEMAATESKHFRFEYDQSLFNPLLIERVEEEESDSKRRPEVSLSQSFLQGTASHQTQVSDAAVHIGASTSSLGRKLSSLLCFDENNHCNEQ